MLPKLKETFQNPDRFRLALYTAAVEQHLPLVESQHDQSITVNSFNASPSLSPSKQGSNFRIELSPSPGAFAWTVTEVKGKATTWDHFDDGQKKHWRNLMESKLREMRRKLKIIHVISRPVKVAPAKPRFGVGPSTPLSRNSLNYPSPTTGSQQQSDGIVRQSQAGITRKVSATPPTRSLSRASTSTPSSHGTPSLGAGNSSSNAKRDSIGSYGSDSAGDGSASKEGTGGESDDSSSSEDWNGATSDSMVKAAKKKDKKKKEKPAVSDWKMFNGARYPVFWSNVSHEFHVSVKSHLESGFLPLPAPYSTRLPAADQVSFQSHQQFRTYIVASAQLHGFRTVMTKRRSPARDFFTMNCTESEKCEWKMTVKSYNARNGWEWRCESVGKHKGHEVLSVEDAKEKWENERKEKEVKEDGKKRKRDDDATASSSKEPTEKRQKTSESSIPSPVGTATPLSEPTVAPSSANATQPRISSISPSSKLSPSHASSTSTPVVTEAFTDAKVHPFYPTLLAFLTSFSPYNNPATDDFLLKFLNGGFKEEKDLHLIFFMDHKTAYLLAEQMKLTLTESRVLMKIVGEAGNASEGGKVEGEKI